MSRPSFHRGLQLGYLIQLSRIRAKHQIGDTGCRIDARGLVRSFKSCRFKLETPWFRGLFRPQVDDVEHQGRAHVKPHLAQRSSACRPAIIPMRGHRRSDWPKFDPGRLESDNLRRQVEPHTACLLGVRLGVGFDVVVFATVVHHVLPEGSTSCR